MGLVVSAECARPPVFPKHPKTRHFVGGPVCGGRFGVVKFLVCHHQACTRDTENDWFETMHTSQLRCCGGNSDCAHLSASVSTPLACAHVSNGVRCASLRRGLPLPMIHARSFPE